MQPAALVAFACAATAALPAGADDLDAAFEIVRKGDHRIGFHVVDVEEGPDGVTVRTHIMMKVSFGPVSFFRFEHEATEFWRDGVLLWMHATTDDNGEKTYVNVERAADAFLIDGSTYQGPAPLDAAPSAYWNKAIVNAPRLISSQNGEIIEVTSEALGETPAPSGSAAEHHRLTGTVALNLWYDGDRWVGSRFVIDGEELIYRPVAEEKKRERLFARLEAEDGDDGAN